MASIMRVWPTLQLLLLLALLLAATVPVAVEAENTTLLFAFGDSYADVGNTINSGPRSPESWRYPYGISWPNGTATGRFSDGKTQTDWIKDLLGLPVYPPPYFYSAGADNSSGVNFAVGGSGVTPALYNVTLEQQVDNFERFLLTDPYSKAALANSVTLVSVVGNDYSSVAAGSISLDLVDFVVSGIQTNLQRLYDLGLRNVMVANLLNPDCTPLFTQQFEYARCWYFMEPIALVHNEKLLGKVQSVNAQNPGARFIILNQHSAFERLYKNASANGFPDELKPCCEPTSSNRKCGDVDPDTQKPLYTVCDQKDRAIFWDAAHLTMWAWNYIINLYANEPGYILLADAPTFKQWLHINDVVQEPIGAPMAPPDMSFSSDGVFVGPNGQAKVVEPNVYNGPGQVAIQGIDHVILPPAVENI